MKKYFPFFSLLFLISCHKTNLEDPLVAIQVQDRNGLTETISSPERLDKFQNFDFLSSQPYEKVLRIYRGEGKNRAKITTYHPSGVPKQYLEVEEMRAHGLYSEWHPNGQKKVEAHVIAGTAELSSEAQKDWIFDGLSQVWDEEGNLLAKISYEKGLLEGESLYFFPSGQLERAIPFVKNQISGELLEYFPEGALKTKSAYLKGVKHGLTLSYFKSGEAKSIEEYTDDLLLKAGYYSSNGELLSEVENGWGAQVVQDEEGLTFVEIQRGKPEGKVKRYTPHRDLIGFYSLKEGMKHGEEVEYFLPQERNDDSEEPIKKLSLTWVRDAVHGPVKTWYNNGQLQSQKEYIQNGQSGSSCAWYKGGSLMFIEEYEGGKLVKGYYYKLGQTDPVSSVVEGNGTASLFDEEGVFLKKVSYVKGKPSLEE